MKRNTSNNPLFVKMRELETRGRKMSDYPFELITNYRAGKISRQQFTKQFSDWQKSRGINYDCKGYADKSGVYITYRGIVGKIKSGIIKFSRQNIRQRLGYINKNAKTVFEFRRKVDFSLNAINGGAKWN